jgi:hypothetical protein
MEMKNSKKLMVAFSVFVIASTTSIQGFSQSGIFEEEVVYARDSTETKEDLFVKAHEWFAINFRSANHVIQMADKEAGKIIGKGIVKVPLNNWGLLEFTFIVECRDGRYKYTMRDVNHIYTDTHKTWGGDITVERTPAIPMKMFKSGWDKVREAGSGTINTIIFDFKTHMNESADVDW